VRIDRRSTSILYYSRVSVMFLSPASLLADEEQRRVNYLEDSSPAYAVLPQKERQFATVILSELS
jgi:hypothetical protein